MSNNLRMVIDTNVFITSFFGGIPKDIIDLWKDGKIILCLSQNIVEEYIEVLNRLGLQNKKEMHELTRLFAEGCNSVFAATTPQIRIVKDDPDDDKFIECAVELDSKIIISGDEHLKEIKKYIDIEILSPREFIIRYSGK
ncbi:MAG: putative toxin-antitoxin system toxin component, PIN family [Deltaproteobacteria bacterium]|nr:putative toxin-antitoxin system toxin component, PIN family [Deltaproteobacteria bacterium]